MLCVMCIYKQHIKKKGRQPLKILISNTSESPLYQQIKEQIKDAILKEKLVEGDPLPSIRALFQHISHQTLIKLRQRRYKVIDGRDAKTLFERHRNSIWIYRHHETRS